MLPIRFSRKRIETIILLGVFIAFFFFLLAIYTQKTYRATTDLLIVQNEHGVTDYYALYKSSEYLSRVLTESVYSEKFLDEINAGGLVSTSSFLPEDKLQRIKSWRKVVKVSRGADSGVVTVEILDDNPNQAKKISEAVIQVLTDKNSVFLGEGKNLQVQVLSGPFVERNLSALDFAAIMVGGFMLGAVLMGLWFYYRDQNGNDDSGKKGTEEKNKALDDESAREEKNLPFYQKEWTFEEIATDDFQPYQSVEPSFNQAERRKLLH